jgi:hypothetical protein
MRKDDWSEFSTDTIEDRLAKREMELVDKWSLLKMISESFADEGNVEVSQAIKSLIDQNTASLQ